MNNTGVGVTLKRMLPQPMPAANDWGFCRPTLQPPIPNRASVPPPKKTRQETGPVTMKRTLVTLAGSSTKRKKTVAKSTEVGGPSKQSGFSLTSQDILICGVCKLEFTNLHTLAQHKKTPCRLRFSCQCQDNPRVETDSEPLPLECASCGAIYFSAWDLCQHCQVEHKLVIFKSNEITDVQEPDDNENEENVEDKATIQASSGDTVIKA